ncbi:MAG TPA: SWIM zinc finger family protein [Symbiobacteriaceae bacterium]|nr:SWIM zinc finger family protein [Symbiobacteriaceae bacterium]
MFTDAGVRLLPVSARELTTTCSCPDWANPCKHVAAVFYQLAAAFDADPFLLLQLRGRDREALLAEIRAHRAAAAQPAPGAVPAGEPGGLTDDLSRFWQVAVQAPPIRLEVRTAQPQFGTPPELTRVLAAKLHGYYATIGLCAAELAGAAREEGEAWPVFDPLRL